MCAINLDCWLCALGASEKILFSQLAPKGTCRRRRRRGTAVTNYSFCLGRSQTFLISYQRSSATLRSYIAIPAPPMFSSYFDSRTHTHIYYTPSRFLFCHVGNLQRFFRSPRLPVMVAVGQRARPHSDGYPFNGAAQDGGVERIGPTARGRRVEDLYARARSWTRGEAAVETLKTSVCRFIYYIYIYICINEWNSFVRHLDNRDFRLVLCIHIVRGM